MNLSELIRRIYRFYFPSVPFDMALCCQRTQAVRRLSSAVKPGWRAMFWARADDAVGGRVTRDRVVLYRIHGHHHARRHHKINSWKPVLFARFRTVDGTLRLQGQFTIAPLMQVFTSVWLLLAFLITGYIFLLMFFGSAFGTDEEIPFSFPAAGLALLGGGTWLIRWAWQWSADDMDAIAQFLENEVGTEDEPVSLQSFE